MPTLYVTDLDGTLLDGQGRVPEASARILNRLIGQGMLFTVATARTPATVVDLLAGVDLRLPAVLMTGTLLYDVGHKKAMATTPFSPHALDALCTLLDATGQEALLYCARDDHLTAYYRRLTGRFARAFVAGRQGTPYKTFTQVPSFARAARGADALVALLCLDSPADASRWYKALTQLDDVTCYCYADEYGRGYTVEAYPAGCDKATGLAPVKRLCGADRVVAFGDSVNDLSLFAASDEACAVAGACPEARQAADHVIGANTENGVARWLLEHFIPQEDGAPPRRTRMTDPAAPALPDIAGPLLAWYDQHKRILPFRQDPTPYHVWVSEIMLQQTRVSAALSYYQRFMEALPTVADLALCPEDKLLKLWEGLGYYSRARNLQKAARLVMEQYGGRLPASYEELQKLPGIGAYTAGAIASISFGLPAPAVDGNVLRVFSRLLADGGDILKPDTKRRMTEAVLALQPPARPGDYNQALMELGALVCLPGGEPQCGLCPLAPLCAARAAGRQTDFPVKAKAPARKALCYTVCLVLRPEADGVCSLLLTRRPDEGLLAGLWQPVLLPGRLDKEAARAGLAALGIQAEPQTPLRTAKHIFTHLEWHMTGFVCRWLSGLPEGAVWAGRGQLDTAYALPTAVKVYADIARSLL